ncbi:acyl-CoA--sterol O-acyltransferase 1-like [Heracleum sosnowskyi]|uniref:Acyl-CoA--sterol O-acyltransferase 1-like n=1 Tax=Heracleum sosnowskyi TaxID=360622 RepID=A0AAD8I5P0_9APIA|nr:acyl-CoA--sterol O-acyltransferase 1-like [Heracleum sosnowskyi]
MEGELNNFAMVWITVLASLYYCHTIAKLIPKGTIRFLTILPISILFIFLPLNLNTMHLGASSSFFIACLELILAMFAALARVLMQAELEPPFDEPYLATSLQDFWGKRWNLMVTNILKPTIFEPTRNVFTGLVGRKWAIFPSVFATFFVSGLMHELVFYTYGRQKTRWEVTCFFLIHGVSLGVEMGLKKLVNGKFRLPRTVSGPLAIIPNEVSCPYL